MIAAIALAAFSVPRRVGHVGKLDIAPLGASDTSVMLLVMRASVLSVLGVLSVLRAARGPCRRARR